MPYHKETDSDPLEFLSLTSMASIIFSAAARMRMGERTIPPRPFVHGNLIGTQTFRVYCDLDFAIVGLNRAGTAIALWPKWLRTLSHPWVLICLSKWLRKQIGLRFGRERDKERERDIQSCSKIACTCKEWWRCIVTNSFRTSSTCHCPFVTMRAGFLHFK